MKLEERNQKIIEALIKKAEKVCPGSLAMIGINGSFMTGDYHEKSDLDLLILINDDNGWKLGDTFIQDDLGVGHDLYCTTWEHLEEDACYTHPNVSKLLDAKIVYCADSKYQQRLDALREKVHNILNVPFGKEDFEKAERFLKEAEHCYVEAMMTEDTAELRVQAGYVIYNLVDGFAMLNKTYFKRGVKRAYEELRQMEKKPDNLCEMIETVMQAQSVDQVRMALTCLLKATKEVFKQEEVKLCQARKPAFKDDLKGSYEEMYSNWKNKMHLAVKEKNLYLSYMSMISFQNFLDEIHSELDIPTYQVFEDYVPGDLEKMAYAFDCTLQAYGKEYEKVGAKVEHYPEIDSFLKAYLMD